MNFILPRNITPKTSKKYPFPNVIRLHNVNQIKQLSDKNAPAVLLPSSWFRKNI